MLGFVMILGAIVLLSACAWAAIVAMLMRALIPPTDLSIDARDED